MRSHQLNTATRILATDLDGTLIPLDNTDDAYREALEEITILASLPDVCLVFATGRSYLSSLSAIAEESLPIPHFLICDVGTAIHTYENGRFYQSSAYTKVMEHLMDSVLNQRIQEELSILDFLTLQPQAHQTPFKISYYTESEHVDTFAEQASALLMRNDLPHSLIHCIDPYEDFGMIDILPTGVSKCYALKWLLQSLKISERAVVYAGDSGNDFEVLTSGLNSIVVNNASQALKDRIRLTANNRSILGNIYFAEYPATLGVREGLEHFCILKNTTKSCKS